ncbi:hypothetical protein KC338_g70 [Hortaea werneckii]|nr:hypothetical protein KC338_g70 [Hortaea werneckii]
MLTQSQESRHCEVVVIPVDHDPSTYTVDSPQFLSAASRRRMAKSRVRKKTVAKRIREKEMVQMLPRYVKIVSVACREEDKKFARGGSAPITDFARPTRLHAFSRSVTVDINGDINYFSKSLAPGLLVQLVHLAKQSRCEMAGPVQVVGLASSPGSTQTRLPASSHRLPTVSASAALQELETFDSNKDVDDSGSSDSKLPKGALQLPGGFETNRVTEIWGPSGAGKTALLLQTAAERLKSGKGVTWIDADTPLTLSPSHGTNIVTSSGPRTTSTPRVPPGRHLSPDH